jgi:hypothetical protein
LAGEQKLKANIGDVVTLDASASSDPDDDKLRFSWRYYAEPGDYRGAALKLEPTDGPIVSFTAPTVERPTSLHLIVIVTDQGEPPLTRYARVVINVLPHSN